MIIVSKETKVVVTEKDVKIFINGTQVTVIKDNNIKFDVDITLNGNFTVNGNINVDGNIVCTGTVS